MLYDCAYGGHTMAYNVYVAAESGSIRVAKRVNLSVALLLAAQWERSGRSVEVIAAQ